MSRYWRRTSSTGARRPTSHVTSTAAPAPMTVSTKRSRMSAVISPGEVIGVIISANTVTNTTATA